MTKILSNAKKMVSGNIFRHFFRANFFMFVLLLSYHTVFLVQSQAAQTLFVIYIRDSIALYFEPFKRMYENGSKIALNSTFSKGFK